MACQSAAPAAAAGRTRQRWRMGKRSAPRRSMPGAGARGTRGTGGREDTGGLVGDGSGAVATIGHARGGVKFAKIGNIVDCGTGPATVTILISATNQPERLRGPM